MITVAERVHLNSANTVVSGIIMIAIAIGGIFLNANLSNIIGLVVCIALLILIIILTIVELVSISYNNALPSTVITYFNGKFTIIDENGENTIFVSTDLIDMDYKLKKTHIFTPYYSRTTIWNYGRLRIWLRIPGEEDLCTRITLKNIVDPDRVVDKIQCINELKNII